jgi:hypothetical protein
VHTSTWKHIGIALATLAALSLTSAVLWMLYGNALVPAERLLPATTAALVTNADAETMRLLKTWMPALAGMSEPENRTDISTLILAEGTVLPALLTPELSLNTHPYAVQGADQAKMLIGNPAESLEKTDAYLTLLPGKHPDAAWAYMNPAMMGTGSRLSPWSWLHLTRPFALSLSPSAIDVAIVDKAAGGLPTLSKQIPSVFAHPIFSVQGTDLLSLADRAEGGIAPDALFALKSLITDAIRGRVGKDVSLTYDVLPLLEGETALHLGTEGNTKETRFLLEGTLTDGVQERLDLIVASFRSSLPAVKRETLTFEKGFTSDTLAEDTNAVEAQTLSVEGWEIHTVLHKESGHALVAAVKGDRFLLSDSPAAIEARVRRTLPSITLAGIHGSLLAGGIVNRREAGALGLQALREAWTTAAALPSSLGDTFLWSLVREHNRLVLHLESLPLAAAR